MRRQLVKSAAKTRPRTSRAFIKSPVVNVVRTLLVTGALLIPEVLPVIISDKMTACHTTGVV